MAVVQPQRSSIDDRAFLDDDNDASGVADPLVGFAVDDHEVGKLSSLQCSPFVGRVDDGGGVLGGGRDRLQWRQTGLDQQFQLAM